MTEIKPIYFFVLFAGNFAIDPNNGDLTTTRRIVASPQHQLVDNVTVFASDGGGLKSKLSFQITIVDINDHEPRFSQPEHSIVGIPEV